MKVDLIDTEENQAINFEEIDGKFDRQDQVDDQIESDLDEDEIDETEVDQSIESEQEPTIENVNEEGEEA